MTYKLLASSAPSVLATFTVSTPGNDRLARFDARWVKSPVTIICAHGEIDQANAHTSPSIHSPTWRVAAS